MPGTRKLVGAIAAVVLVGAILAIVLQNRPRRSPPFPSQDWFYDLNTGQLFPGPRAAVPPIDAPSGPLPDGTPAGARAHVYGCDGCSETSRVVAWLETYSVEHRDLLRGPGTLPRAPEQDRPHIPGPEHVDLLSGIGRLVKRPADPEWTDSATPEGQALMTGPQCPDGAAPAECRP